MLLIKNGCIHDAVSREPYIADIVVENGKITAINTGTMLSGALPDSMDNCEAEVLDIKGLNVYPGLVDAHSHLGLDGYAIGFESQDYNEMNDIVTPQLRAIDGFYPQDETVKLARA